MEIKSRDCMQLDITQQYTRFELRELLNKESQISLLSIIRSRELTLEDWFTHLQQRPVPKPSFCYGISGPLLYPITLQSPPFPHLVKLSNLNKFEQWLSKFPRPGVSHWRFRGPKWNRATLKCSGFLGYYGSEVYVTNSCLAPVLHVFVI
ncbi:hypothetical protein CEXT_553441 [Caerostris extrusa]|uniref:Uncharacterized protein n=1 Tax=Caerostris extrusa TaxID=172846 RepID=A0AAV4MBA8_CAEEX|nr:hypothetical protein CEXT_553441 [Caerostris extrusa]